MDGIMPNKDNILSNFDINTIYQTSDIKVFDLDANVVSNQLQITQSDSVIRSAGTYKGSIGRQIEFLYLDGEGKLVQENNNNIADNIFGQLHYPVEVFTRFPIPTPGSPGVFTGVQSLYGQTLASKQIQDTTRYTHSAVDYRFVVPTNVTWTGTTNGQISVTSSDGIEVRSNSILNSGYDLTRMFNRTSNNGFDGHVWMTGTTASDNYFKITLPVTKLVTGFMFKNMRTDFATTSFRVKVSLNDISYTTVAEVTSIPSLLADVVQIFTPVECKYIRFEVITANNAGSVGRFDLLTLQNPVIENGFNFKQFGVDSRFYTLTETPSSYELNVKSAEEIQAGSIYANGLLEWEKYSRFEHRTTTGITSAATSGFSTRALNTTVVNNIGIRPIFPSLSVPAGVYFVRASINSYATNYTSLILSDSLGNTLLAGQTSWTDNTFASGSSASPKLQGLIYLSATTTIQLRNYFQAAYAANTAQGIGNVVAGVNTSDSYAYLEFWKVMEIDELADGTEQDQYWGNVSLLLNGTQSWVDNSSYKLPVMNVGTVPLVPALYGNGYDTSVSPRYLHTLPFIQLGSKDFTIECVFRVNNFTSAQGIISDNIHSTSASWSLYLKATTGAITFDFGGLTDVCTVPGLIQINTWYHVAVCRQGSVGRLFVNGELVNVFTITANLTGTRVMIGKSNNLSATLAGIVANVRITQNIDRFKTATTLVYPPTSPYTKDSVDNIKIFTEDDQNYQNVTALLNGTEGFDDSSEFNSVVTNSGSTLIAGPHGDVFVSTGAQRVSIGQKRLIGTGDFTAECWYKRDTGGGDAQGIFAYGQYNSSVLDFAVVSDTAGNLFLSVDTTQVIQSTPAQHGATLSNWNHIALVRNRGCYYLFVNGKIAGGSVVRTDNYSTLQPLIIGSHAAAYVNASQVSDFRFTHAVRYTGWYLPQDVVTTGFVPDSYPTKYGDSDWKGVLFASRALSSDVIDYSEYAMPLTKQASITYQDVVFADGSTVPATLHNAASTAYYLPARAHTSMKSRDFTVECWYKPLAKTVANGSLVSGGNSAYDVGSWRIATRHSFAPNKFCFMVYNFASATYMLVSTSDVVVDTWYHVAVTRSGNVWRLFVNGVLEHVITSAVNLSSDVTSPVWIGSDTTGNSTTVATGYITEARITAYARYTDTFVPPYRFTV